MATTQEKPGNAVHESDSAASDPEKLQAEHDDGRYENKALANDPTEGHYDIPWTFTRVVAVGSLCIVYVGSQLILYFADPALAYIAAAVDTKYPNWILTTNTLAVAAIAPFVGYITDLLGRRWVCIGGTVCLLISSILIAASYNFATVITGMAFGGIGAGICELTALAGVAEITPVRWRGASLALVTFTILPFMPSVIYVLELQQAGSWRWSFLIVAIWNLIGFFGLIFCYKPPPRHNADGLTKGEIIRRIDYVGTLLSVGGVTIFLVGLQAGGYEYPWTSATVLAPLIIGLVMIVIMFPLWEVYGTKYPMVPWAIFEGQRVVALAFVIVFIAGMNFYSILSFFPLMLEFQFAPTKLITVGIRALSYPFAILGGACFGSLAISYSRGHVRELFVINAAIMCAFGGALAATSPNTPGLALAMETLDSFGIGAIIVPSLTLALYACPDEYIGTTTALSLTSRFLGGSVGVGIYYNVFKSKLTAHAPEIAVAAVKAGLPTAEAASFVEAFLVSPIAAEKIKGVTATVLGAATAAQAEVYAESLKWVWITTIPFSAVAVLCCLALPNIKRFMSGRVAVDIH